MRVLSRVFAPAEPQFRFQVTQQGPRRTSLCATGELDIAAAPHLHQLIAASEAAGRTYVFLDLSEVTFIDCSCLRVLVDAHSRLQPPNGQLILTAISTPVRKLLERTSLHHVLMTPVSLTAPADLAPDPPSSSGPADAESDS